jgi:hypothetical protein
VIEHYGSQEKSEYGTRSNKENGVEWLLLPSIKKKRKEETERI